jgi:hypothetical protein
LAWLRKREARHARLFEKAVALTAAADPGLRQSAKPKVTPSALLAASSQVKLAVSNLK